MIICIDVYSYRHIFKIFAVDKGKKNVMLNINCELKYNLKKYYILISM